MTRIGAAGSLCVELSAGAAKPEPVLEPGTSPQKRVRLANGLLTKVSGGEPRRLPRLNGDPDRRPPAPAPCNPD
jgi:hypothetical protein